MSKIFIIPEPVFLKETGGTFRLSGRSRILSPEDVKCSDPVLFLAEEIAGMSGLRLSIEPGYGSEGDISLSIDENLIGHGAEAYRLAVSRERVIMDGASPAGLMRAAATFLQMVPVQGKKCSDPEEIHVHCAEILDYPRFPWRGMNLDCSRHFMTVDFVKRYINLLALYKMNILHWHLTDDQGWRPEIKRYSRLSSVGAWRRGSDGSAYGGFYTREDMEDIIS
jgi:hexosaminidase